MGSSKIELAMALAAAIAAASACAAQPRPRPTFVADENGAGCPLGIRDAKVEVADVPGGVDVTFTSDSSAGVDEIRVRVRDTAMMHGPGSDAGLGHDGEHRQQHGHAAPRDPHDATFTANDLRIEDDDETELELLVDADNFELQGGGGQFTVLGRALDVSGSTQIWSEDVDDGADDPPGDDNGGAEDDPPGDDHGEN